MIGGISKLAMKIRLKSSASAIAVAALTSFSAIQLAAQEPPPQDLPSISGVCESAGCRELVSPGAIVSVFGFFAERTSSADSIPLSPILDGLAVTFNGSSGAIFGVFFRDDFGAASDQINAQAPWDLDVSSGKVTVRVVRAAGGAKGNALSDPFIVDAAQASPGIFMVGSRAIVTNASGGDGDVIQGSWAQPEGFLPGVTGQPAAIGGVVTVWVNALGPLTLTPETGAASGLENPLPLPTKKVRVFVGGVEATSVTAFLQQTNVGLHQINMVVPNGAPLGDEVPIVIEVECDDGTVLRSREDATIAVRSNPSTGGRAVGSTCEYASDCLSGLVCPLAPGGAGRVCTDPMAGVFDDSSGPALTDAGRGWLRKRVDGWEEQDLRCNDGSPYAYYISLGEGAEANNWLFYLRGGAQCIDDEDCALRWLVQPRLMRQNRTITPNYTPGVQAGVAAGIFARDEPSNHFHAWTFVNLQYCSSDAFSGTATPEQNLTGFYFRGHEIAKAVVEELLDGIDPRLPSLANADQVVVAGNSAGSSAARHNMDRIASQIRVHRPSAVVKGIADSSFVPPMLPGRYRRSGDSSRFWGLVADADCLEAHPDAPQLCTDEIHLLNGHGTADHNGGVDAGHLGVAASSENGAVDGVFVYMAQFDPKATAQVGAVGWCVRDSGCVSHADCGGGRGCFQGVCYDVQPCAPSYCTPADGACYGLDDPPSCLGLVATHANECDDNDPAGGGCAAGEVCAGGFCILDRSGCESNSDCPVDFQCGRGGACTRGASDASECTLPGFRFEPDTLTCDQVTGCSETSPCPSGYRCLPGEFNSAGQTLSWGIREEFSGLAPDVGVYAPNAHSHTAISGIKYYGVTLPEIAGDTFAETLDAWLSGSPDYFEHIAGPDETPLPLWAWEVESFTAGGLDERTAGTGCDDDAVVFRLCEADSACAAPADALATIGVGDSGTTSADGASPADPVRLKIVIETRPTCGAPVLEPAPGSYLELVYRYGPGLDNTHTVKAAVLGQQILFPQTVWIGADGAIYLDPELTRIVAGRLE